MPQRQHETCTISGCTRPHKARGYCQAHYQLYKRGKPLDTEIKTRDTTVYDHCSEEGCDLPVKAKGLCMMHYARTLRHGHTRYTDRKKPAKTCKLDGCSDILYAKGLCHKHYLQKLKYAKNYGITPEIVMEMSISQGDRCAICGTRRDKIHHLSQRLMELVVDHDHHTKKVRGLLCDRCNRAIGLLGDNPDLLAKALAYLIKHHQDPGSALNTALAILQG